MRLPLNSSLSKTLWNPPPPPNNKTILWYYPDCRFPAEHFYLNVGGRTLYMNAFRSRSKFFGSHVLRAYGRTGFPRSIRILLILVALFNSFTCAVLADTPILPGTDEPGNKQLELDPPSGPLIPRHETGGEENFDIEPLHTTTPPAGVKAPAGIFSTLLEKSSETAEPSDPSKLDKAEFGVVTDREGPSKNWQTYPVVVIPNMPGVQYMWKLKTNFKAPVFVREEFILPEAPSTWKVRSSSAQLIDGGRECVMESFQPVDDGWVGHAWTVSPGDPAGLYEIRISLNGKLAHKFVFNVGEPLNDPATLRRDY